MQILKILIIILYLLIFSYCIYQYFRFDTLIYIFKKWNDTENLKILKYSLKKEFKPSKYNWYGLKWPEESDYI